MFAVAQWRQSQRDREEKTEYLQAQLQGCTSICEETRHILCDFLIEEDIFDLSEISEETRLALIFYLQEQNIRAKSKVRTCLAGLDKVRSEHQQLQYAGLLAEIQEYDLNRPIRNKAAQFLMDCGIKSLSEIDCEVRERYIAFLETDIAKSKVQEYVKGLDRLKLYAIKKWEDTHPLQRPELTYVNRKIYLSYLPIYEIAASFYYTQDKQSLIWDFSVSAPDRLKRQVFYMLAYELVHNKDVKDLQVRFILPLKWLYLYCVENQVEDLEYLEKAQIERFREVVAGKVVNVGNSMQIIDNTRKRLFMDAMKTNWNANVWYMERFHLARERINPSNFVYRFSFLDVLNRENRTLFQSYMKYLIGTTMLSMAYVRQHYYFVLEFLMFLDQKGISVLSVRADKIDDYVRLLEEEKTLLPATFNVKLSRIYHFFRFLKIKRYIEKVPFLLEYYWKTAVPLHHDRSVEVSTVMLVLRNLYHFPMKLRLMYLILWCVGLRVNEVCCLLGNAFYWDGNAAWLRSYQNKMRAEKNVPVPTMLYKLVTDYIKKNNIQPNDYIFQSQKGGAYSSNTFCKQMAEGLKACGIECDEYNFHSHDYRHTVATFLYTHGASLQAVRDYLGHEREEMTMQYVDYMPEMIDKANEEYYSKPGNNLAACLKKGKKHGK